MAFDVSVKPFEAPIKWFFVPILSFDALAKAFDKNSDTIDIARVTSESAIKCVCEDVSCFLAHASG